MITGFLFDNYTTHFHPEGGTPISLNSIHLFGTVFVCVFNIISCSKKYKKRTFQTPGEAAVV